MHRVHLPTLASLHMFLCSAFGRHDQLDLRQLLQVLFYFCLSNVPSVFLRPYPSPRISLRPVNWTRVISDSSYILFQLLLPSHRPVFLRPYLSPRISLRPVTLTRVAFDRPTSSSCSVSRFALQLHSTPTHHLEPLPLPLQLVLDDRYGHCQHKSPYILALYSLQKCHSGSLKITATG